MKTDTKTLAATLRKVADGDTVRDCLGRVAADRLDELERDLAELTEWREMIDREVGTLREELATERELADRLLAIAEKAVSDHEGTLHCDCDCKCSRRRIANDNAESLTAWKEARRGTV